MPVEDRPVHASGKRSDDQPYHCYNRTRDRPVRIVQDGWTWDGKRNLVELEDTGSIECQYERATTDPRCHGCRHAKKN